MMPDIYIQLAADAFKKPPADVTAAEREFGKALAFRHLYGASQESMVQRLGISTADAARCTAAFTKRFPNLCKS